MSLFYWEPRPRHSAPGVASPVLRERITSLNLLAQEAFITINIPFDIIQHLEGLQYFSVLTGI